MTETRALRGPEPVVVSAAAVTSAAGRGIEPLLSAVLDGRPMFRPVERFDVGGRRVRTAATLDGSPDLAEELARVVDEACDEVGLTAAQRADCLLFLAVHGHPGLAGALRADRSGLGADAFAAAVAQRSGLSSATRTYTSACVAASTAVADAAAMIARGRAKRIVVAAGYLVEAYQFALFDAGRALAVDGQVRPLQRRPQRAPPGRCRLRRRPRVDVRRGATGPGGRLGPSRRRLPRLPTAPRRLRARARDHGGIAPRRASAL